ncbi:type II toxin-antitoxin system HicB family antitoxin [Paenarthrobacter sp. CAP02]|uniref:type II toxin-antitoxin system HicB family antitoxin n=1 Tax=Paenarthrobacter sp. CAP02 TaxID=3158144 RepID=UPI0032DBC082
MRKLTARAERGSGWWVIEVPEIEGLLTQAKTLGQVEFMVKDAAALITGEPEESFEVQVVPVISEEVREHLAAAKKLFEQAAKAQHSAAEESRLAARGLAASGLTVRDVGTVLGVSHQRAHQLVK